MRAAVIVDPAKADVPDLREQVDKTLGAAGWSAPLWLETTPEDPGRGMAEAAVAGLRRHRTRDPHLERFRGRSVLVEADRIVPRQMDGEVADDGRSLNAQIAPGALVVRVPQPVATALTE